MRTPFKIIILLLLLSGGIFAQADKDRLEALRMNFISKRIQLSDNEAGKFWPVYNEYHDKLRLIRRNLRQGYLKAGDNPGEQQAQELYNMELQSRQAEVDLYRVYSEKLRSIIGTTRLAKLRIAEEQFRKEIINNIRERSD